MPDDILGLSNMQPSSFYYACVKIFLWIGFNVLPYFAPWLHIHKKACIYCNIHAIPVVYAGLSPSFFCHVLNVIRY